MTWAFCEWANGIAQYVCHHASQSRWQVIVFNFFLSFKRPKKKMTKNAHFSQWTLRCDRDKFDNFICTANDGVVFICWEKKNMKNKKQCHCYLRLLILNAKCIQTHTQTRARAGRNIEIIEIDEKATPKIEFVVTKWLNKLLLIRCAVQCQCDSHRIYAWCTKRAERESTRRGKRSKHKQHFGEYFTTGFTVDSRKSVIKSVIGFKSETLGTRVLSLLLSLLLAR